MNQVTLANADITVYAVWGFATIIVEIDEDGNAAVTTPLWVDAEYEIVKNNDRNITITFSPDTNKDSITTIVPSYWTYDIVEGENDEIIVVITPPSQNLTTHNVTFILNGGNIANDTTAVVISVIEGETIGDVIPVPTQINHTFNGWQENRAGIILNSSYVAALTVNEPRTFTASWTRINTGGGWIAPQLPAIPDEVDETEESDIYDEPEQEERPLIEELPQDELSIQEVREFEQPIDEPYESTGETPIIESDSEEDYVEVEISIVIEEPRLEENVRNVNSIIVEFTLTDVGNPVSGNVRHFRIIHHSSPGLQFLSGEIPMFTNGNGLFYMVRYRTNLNNSPRNMANNIPADRPFLLLPPLLRNGEIITEIIIEFDSVPAGFRMNNTIIYRFINAGEYHATNHWNVTTGEANERNFFIGATLYNISRISSRQDMYDAISWTSLQDTITVVQEILNNPNSTLEEIENAYFLLQQAIRELNPISFPTTVAPFGFGGMFVAILVFVLVMSLIALLIKLLKYKKYMILSPSNICKKQH